MKNKLNIVLAVLWLLIALFFTGILIRKISGKNIHILFSSEVADKVFGETSINGTFDNLSIGDINTLYKSYSFSTSEIEEFSAELISSSIHVEPYDGKEISVNLYGNWNADLEPEVKVERGKLVIKKSSVRIMNWNKLGSRKLVINVPENACSNLFDAQFSTVSGSIHVTDVSFRELETESTSGSIHVDGYVDSLDADTVSGSIHVNGTCRNMHAESTSGSIHINGTCGNINADTTSGSIHFETDAPLVGDNVFNSTSGSINITIPEESACEFEWETVSGSVSNAFYKGKCGKSGSQIIGDGDTQICASTVSGSIHLNKN